MFEIEGIVIRVTPFRDNDAMVNVISHERMNSFLGRGVLKYESKNASSVNMYSRSRFQLSKGKDGMSLRTGELLNSYQMAKSNLDSLAVLDMIGEVTNKLVQSEDAPKIYDQLVKCLELLDSGFDAFTIGLIYLAHVLNATGYGLDVDSCIICGKTSQIIAVSYKDGGFICQDCFDPLNHVKCSARKLKIIRYIFKVDVTNYDKVSFNKNETIELLKELHDFIYDVAQIDLKSITLLKKI